MLKYRKLAEASLFLVILLLYLLLPDHMEWVEHTYSRVLYPYVSQMLSLFSFLPFSLGDILYSCFLLWILYFPVKIALDIRRKRFHAGRALVNTCRLLSLAVVYFLLAWGLNGKRLSLSKQLGWKIEKYNDTDVSILCQQVLDSLIAIRPMAVQDSAAPLKRLNQAATVGYERLYKKKIVPYLPYGHAKYSLYAKQLNYLHISGYYNPFTGESQILHQPWFNLPFTICHELAHQIGYVAEDEANFLGFLSAIKSPSPTMRYSGFFNSFIYLLSELQKADSYTVKEIVMNIPTEVRADIIRHQKFINSHRSQAGRISSEIYDKVLKFQGQKKGLATYREVIRLLIFWGKHSPEKSNNLF